MLNDGKPNDFHVVEEDNTVRVPIGESVTVQENVEVTMDCVELIDDLKHSAEANPIITWYKNGMKIRGNGTYKNIMISADKRYCIIAATQLAVGGELGTTGDYTCKVCSGNGTADCENKTSSQVVCGE